MDLKKIDMDTLLSTLDKEIKKNKARYKVKRVGGIVMVSDNNKVINRINTASNSFKKRKEYLHRELGKRSQPVSLIDTKTYHGVSFNALKKD